MEKSLFFRMNKLNQASASVRYCDSFDAPYKTLAEHQLNDVELWKLLVRQFFIQNDGIDNGWRGEYWGKLMRGAALVYKYSQDQALYEVLETTTRELLKQVDKYGRIASYVVEKEFQGWDMWSRKYVMLGLEYFYEICLDESLKKTIIFVLKQEIDYVIHRVGNEEGKIPINETSNTYGGINSVSILQPIVNLYNLTNEKKYLRYAEELIRDQKIDGKNIFALAYKGEKAPFEYPVTKAYEMISCFEGLLDYYLETKNENCLTACINFADKVLETDFTLIGGTGCEDEFFDNSTKMQVVETEINKQETCVSVTLMKFFIALYKQTDDVKYLNAVEKTYLNLYLGALREGKLFGSVEQPLFYSYSPILNNPRWIRMGGVRCISTYARFGCCIAIGAAGAGVIPTVGAMANEDSLSLNFFYGGEYTYGDSIAFTVETKYPRDGEILLCMQKTKQEGVSLRIRKPDWCDAFAIYVNNTEIAYTIKEGYIYLQEKVFADDCIRLKLEMPVKVVSSSQVNEEIVDLFALQKGPILLCADSIDTDLTKRYAVMLDGDGNAIAKTLEDGMYEIALQNGKSLCLSEYRNTGKVYPVERNISVWLKKQ